MLIIVNLEPFILPRLYLNVYSNSSLVWICYLHMYLKQTGSSPKESCAYLFPIVFKISKKQFPKKEVFPPVLLKLSHYKSHSQLVNIFIIVIIFRVTSLIPDILLYTF